MGFSRGQAIDVILVRKLFGGRCEEKGSLVCRAELRGCIQPDRYVQRFNKENEEEEALLSSTHYGVNGRQKRRRRRMCVCVWVALWSSVSCVPSCQRRIPGIRLQSPTEGSRSFYGRTSSTGRSFCDKICIRTSSCPGCCPDR